MSVLVGNALSYAVNEMGVSDLSGILQVVDMQVREKLQKQAQGEMIQDGAEMGIIQIDLHTGELFFAGAKRPLVWYEQGQRKEIPGTPRAIADDPELFKDVPWQSHRLLPHPGDTFYLFSDGYPDQEGSQRPRMGTRRFYELLDELSRLPIRDQPKILEQRLKEWRGTVEQTDDILVIGFRYEPKGQVRVDL